MPLIAPSYYQKATWAGKPIKNAKDLSAAYQAGFTEGNPAESIIAGTIGVWKRGELASAPRNFVYQHVLLNFDVVYPIMSLVINLHDQSAVDSSAAAIEHAISPSQFESTLAMPITREMSAGKRALLLKYLQNIGTTPTDRRVKR